MTPTVFLQLNRVQRVFREVLSGTRTLSVAQILFWLLLAGCGVAPVLPAEETEGPGRFQMFVDNQPWTAAPVFTDLAELPGIEVYPVGEGFFITARRPVDGGYEEFTLRTRLPMLDQTVSAESDTVRMTFRNDPDDCRYLGFVSGTLTVTAYDPEGRKATGAFSVTLQAAGTCGTRTLTGGQFDIRLPEDWP